MKICAKCGHPRSEHDVMAGPNSIGQWAFSLCGHDKWTDGFNAITKCGCYGFKEENLIKRILRLFSKRQ